MTRQLTKSDRKVDTNQLREAQIVIRAQRLKQSGTLLDPKSFAMRLNFFTDSEDGVLSEKVAFPSRKFFCFLG